MEPIKREGTVIATLPLGASLCRIIWRGFPAFLIASQDRPPYVLHVDGSTEEIPFDVTASTIVEMRPA